MTECVGRDLLCPCQDGDVCHYVATPDTAAFPIPSITYKERIMEFLVGLGLGVALGWVIFEKPEWMRNAWDSIKSKFNQEKT